jgi:hypothetical protein
VNGPVDRDQSMQKNDTQRRRDTLAAGFHFDQERDVARKNDDAKLALPIC